MRNMLIKLYNARVDDMLDQVLFGINMRMCPVCIGAGVVMVDEGVPLFYRVKDDRCRDYQCGFCKGTGESKWVFRTTQAIADYYDKL